MNLKKTMKLVEKTLAGKQDPDNVTIGKQWDEFGFLKGYMVYAKWDNGQMLVFDCNNHYHRVIGDLNQIPDYKKGVHQ